MVDQQSGYLRHGKCTTVLGENSGSHPETPLQHFPQVDWGFVFVDDFCWLLRAEDADHVAPAMLATLMALGVPLSWKKTHLAEVNNIPQVQMIATKHTLVLEVLELLIQNTAMTTKSIESLGRLQWAIAVRPLTKSLLQPSWAWKMDSLLC